MCVCLQVPENLDNEFQGVEDDHGQDEAHTSDLQDEDQSESSTEEQSSDGEDDDPREFPEGDDDLNDFFDMSDEEEAPAPAPVPAPLPAPAVPAAAAPRSIENSFLIEKLNDVEEKFLDVAIKHNMTTRLMDDLLPLMPMIRWRSSKEVRAHHSLATLSLEAEIRRTFACLHCRCLFFSSLTFVRTVRFDNVRLTFLVF